MSSLLPADYILGAIAIIMSVMGLFRGLSGVLAFISAVVVAGAVATFGWNYSARYLDAAWARCAVDLIASLFAFGIVRALVKKLVNNILSQPSDAIFGFVIGAGAVVLLAVTWAYLGYYLEYSAIATELNGYIR